MSKTIPLQQLSNALEGDLFFDELHKIIYSTDASVYQIKPIAIAIPKSVTDIQTLVHFANEHQIPLTPRTAGTSLAGQTVGSGIIVDVSKYFTKIVALDQENKTVTVQPGVIRDELNLFLKPYGLFFGPNTSTSNRCMIGGMVGNNSSGTTSIRYGVTRDKIVELKAILSDGSETVFTSLSSAEFVEKTKGNTLENQIYKTVYEELSNAETQKEIVKEFPKPEIHRRNTGYAVDLLLKSDLFSGTEPTINLGTLLCGSEGTLAFTTEVTLKVDDLPPTHNIMVAAHFHTIQESLEAVMIAMKHHLYTCEMMDDTILNCTKTNREQAKNQEQQKERTDQHIRRCRRLQDRFHQRLALLCTNRCASLSAWSIGLFLLSTRSSSAFTISSATLSFLKTMVGLICMAVAFQSSRAFCPPKKATGWLKKSPFCASISAGKALNFSNAICCCWLFKVKC